MDHTRRHSPPCCRGSADGATDWSSPPKHAQKRLDLAHVEELRRRLALEGAQDVGVVGGVGEPAADRHGETGLLAIRHRIGQHATRRTAQRDLVLPFVHLETRRHATSDVEHAQVAQRHADVEPRALHDLRRVEQDAALEIAAQIHVEHPRHRVVFAPAAPRSRMNAAASRLGK